MKVTIKAGTRTLSLEYLAEEFECDSLIVINPFELGSSTINDRTHSKEVLKF